MEGHSNIHHHQYQYHHHHHNQYQYQYVDEEEEEEEERMGGMVGVDTGDSSSSRLPQWSNEETKEFLKIRAELDKTFMETKRNKLLWEVISSKLREKGFQRSAQQCKCKWKNLVTRYKGCETIEIEAMRQQQFPFYNDMQAIFTARVWTTELDTDIIPSRKNKAATTSSSDDNANEGCSLKGRPRKNLSKKAKFVNGGDGNNNIISKGVKEMVGQIMRQYGKMEAEWRVVEEAREEERRRMEREWRMRMVALAEERVAMERRWREREEQRWLREEARAQKRDALIVALLNKISRDDNN